MRTPQHGGVRSHSTSTVPRAPGQPPEQAKVRWANDGIATRDVDEHP